MNELISIIVNVYNEERYIKKCLDSIVNQTYKNIEIIIVNDGSTDNTLKICESYKDNRIKIISQKNIGLSLSRNVGIDNSTGKYVYFLDADDFIENDTIEYLYNLIVTYDADMSTCRTINIYSYDTEIKNQPEKIDILSNIEMLKRLLLNENNSSTIWNKLMKKKLFNNIRFPDRVLEDVPVTYKLVLTSEKIIYSNQIKHNYLKHKESITERKEKDFLVDMYDAKIERYYDLKAKYPNLIENEIAALSSIMYIYIINNKEINDCIGVKEMNKLFKKTFTFKILRCNINIMEKIKMILFRISPKLYKIIIYAYLKIIGKEKDGKSIASN